jgi:hypothetical protein
VELPEKYSGTEVLRHLRMLSEGGFLSGNVKIHGPHLLIVLHGLSWAGHDLLDSIRDDSVWKKTKEMAASVGGSVGLETLKALALKAAQSFLGL